MSIPLKQSTASQSRMVGPFVDDTDGATLETGLTIANTDVKLCKNGAASVNKNSGGGTHRVNGMYSLTFDATDSDTVGELEVSIKMAGALVVKKTFVVLEEAIYDALYASGASGGSLSVALATDSVDSDAIKTGAITASSFAAGAIDSAAIAASAIGESEIASNAITAAKIAAGAISAATFSAGAIDAAAIATDAIDADAIASDVVIPCSDPNAITGSVIDSAGTQVIFHSDLDTVALITQSNVLVGRGVRWLTGGLKGLISPIEAYNGSTGEVTISEAPAAPGNGDTFVIV